MNQAAEMNQAADTADPRYARQIILPEIGPAGQARLADGRVLVVGAGGLGSAVLYGLAGAGVGHLSIVDPDRVSPSNLNRQFLYQDQDIGRLKAEVAAGRLRAYHPDLSLWISPAMLDEQLADELVSRHDLVVSAVDNRAARLLLNAACCRHDKPLVDGGVSGLAGYLAIIEPGRTPCCRCLFGDIQSDTLQPAGVLGAVAATIGSLQATAAVLLLLGCRNPLEQEVLYLDGKTMAFDRVRFSRDPDCPDCGNLLYKAQPGGGSDAW
jgi:adenylyltransferase/sulfurtransferase